MIFGNIKLEDITEFITLFKSKVNFSEEYSYVIRAQFGVPNCSSQAWITCIEYLRQIDGYNYETFSVMYEYYMTRLITHHEKEIVPTYIEDSLESLFLNGAIHASGVHISLEAINTKPSLNKIKDGQSRIINKTMSPKRLEIDVNVFKYVISEMNVPFVAVIYTDKRKMANDYLKIFKHEESDVKDTLHAICIIGYDDDEEVFIFQNSYGKDWHFGGFGKIHYSYIGNITKAIAIEKTCVKSC